MTYKTTGTLKEIGAKVGDVVRIHMNNYTVGEDYIHEDCTCEIISRAATEGPVRTVTRKEIVPGVYGRVEIADSVKGHVQLEFVGEYGHTGRPTLSRQELTAAIATLTEIRDAL